MKGGCFSWRDVKDQLEWLNKSGKEIYLARAGKVKKRRTRKKALYLPSLRRRVRRGDFWTKQGKSDSFS